MLRIAVESDTYLLARPPLGASPGEVEARIRAAASGRPQVIVWDGVMQGRRLRFGEGLDELLLAQLDATGCCAVLESAHAKLKDAGPGPTAASLAQLARDLRLTTARAEGLIGELTEASTHGGRRLKPAAHPEMISAVVIAHGSAEGVETFMHAFAAQELASRAEIVVVASGLTRDDARALSDTLDGLKLARPMRVRHFVLPGKMAEATAVNTGMTLAAGQAVVVARPDCLPERPDTIQTLASWAAGGEVFTASPRILDESGRLLAAGMTAEADAAGAQLEPWTDAALSRLVRRTAAPVPWFFAVNRQAWLSHGGAAARGEGLWTAALAESGRHLLAGPTAVVWTGDRRPPAQRQGRAVALSPDSARAMRAATAVSAAVPGPKAEPPAALGDDEGPAEAFGFSDAFPNRAPLRLLIFADGFGASQTLVFVDGLAQARTHGRAAVRIVEARALPQDGAPGDAQLASAIAEHFARTAPTAVVLSRFAHGAAVRRILRTAQARGIPVIAHIDDDLFDLPPIIGIERYRTSRNPRGMLALHRTLEEADLVMTSTPALAERLACVAGHGRVGWLDIGSAGSPRPRAPRPAGQAVVIGYMGSATHNHDLEMIAPALNAVLEAYDHVSVELFGSIARQPAADLLRGRVRRHQPVIGDYHGFKTVLAGLGWDIGLAPLRPIAYNRYKTPTKWVEYAEAGAAVIVSDSEAYQPMIRADAALPAGPDQWEAAMRRLVEDADLRAGIVTAADRLLRSSYGWERMERGVLALLERVARPQAAA